MSIAVRAKAKLARMTVLNDTLRDYRRIARNYPRYLARRRAANSSSNSPLFISKSDGFSIGTVDDMPGLPAIADELRRWSNDRVASIDLNRVTELSKTGAVKPFYFNILSRDDVKAMPHLVEFATSAAMLDVLSPYYGILPELSHMAVFASGLFGDLGGAKRGTQQMHWDNHDRGHIKLFCFLDPVTEADGPLTVLPADKSLWLRKKTGRRLGTHPVKDEREFYRHFSDADLVKIMGPAGTVAFVDTTKCLHFGSRTESGGRRLAFVVHYTMFADYGMYRTGEFQDLNMATSPELRPKHLTGRQALAYRLV